MAVASLVRFVQRVRPYLSGILAQFRWSLETKVMKGINPYALRDDASFFLKIRAAFK